MKKWIEILLVFTLAGCAGSPDKQADQLVAPVEKQTESLKDEASDETSVDPRVLYLLLAAELAGQRNEYETALEGYLQAAKLVDDPRIAERAAKIALFLKDSRRTDEAVQLWLERDSDNLTARKIAVLSAMRKADKDEALKQLNALLALDPAGFDTALMEMSKLMEKDGKDSFIYSVLDELAMQHPDEAHIYFVQALLASRMERNELAMEKNRKALSLQPEWNKAMILQAQLAGRSGDLETAKDYLEKALQQSPDDERLRKLLAQVLMDSKSYDEAIDLYEEVLQRDPDDSESRFAIALIYLQQKKLDKAEKYLQELLHDPAWEAQASFYFGRIEYDKGNDNEALVWFDKVTQGPFLFDARMAAVSLLLTRDRYDEAAERISAIERNFPGQALRILLVKAEMYNEIGRHQKAFDLLTDALKRHPDNRELLYTRALIAERLDKLDVLEADLRHILDKNPDDSGALNALGYTLVDRTNRYAEAEVYLKRALKLQPDEAVIIDSYGWLQFKLGNLTEALEYLQRAYDKQPENEIAAHLAELLWVTGEQHKARRLVEKALKKSPEDRYLLEFQKRFFSGMNEN